MKEERNTGLRGIGKYILWKLRWVECTVLLVFFAVPLVFTVGRVTEVMSRSSFMVEQLPVVITHATSDRFVADDNFSLGVSDDAKAKISYLGNNFVAWFLGSRGKVEEASSNEQTLSCVRLKEPLVDGPIIEELGGVEKAEATLSEMFSLLGEQKDGEEGNLLTDGRANIFYVRDSVGVLRSVSLSWSGIGWVIGARSTDSPVLYGVDSRVFSHGFITEASRVLASRQPF